MITLVLGTSAWAKPCPKITSFLQTAFPERMILDIEDVSAQLTSWDGKTLPNDLAQKNYSYAVDLAGNHYLTDSPLPHSNKAIYMVEGREPKTIVESGKVEMDPVTRAPRMVRVQGENALASRVLDCKTLSTATGKKVLWSYLGTSAVTTTIGLAVSEATGGGRLFKNGKYNSDGAKLIGTELLSTLIGTVVAAGVTSTLNQTNAPNIVAMAVRYGNGFAMNRVNGFMNRKVLDGDAKARSEKIVRFNDFYNSYSMIRSTALEKFLATKLPDLAQKSCLMGLPLKLVLSPTSFRVIDQFSNSAIYYKTRTKLICE